MVGRFISIEVDLLDNSLAVQAEIGSIVAQWQPCLCWIVSDVDPKRKKLVVDAVVLERN
ncbi:hypothetical protein JOY44_28450 (plasmid) [Phormidium sp. CLA17]|uniref:hypothetical protein n=1 Tax=Leptolyngbya sp. Cla-17 TaxID=2803751 RepID=UPI001490A214|nr:hypothetical protein [Leptolyngbya sp. Cla-17]MBM0745360.1 hypothetical protein [Leptolyngbya sp. Cla-17]